MLFKCQHNFIGVFVENVAVVVEYDTEIELKNI